MSQDDSTQPDAVDNNRRVFLSRSLRIGGAATVTAAGFVVQRKDTQVKKAEELGVAPPKNLLGDATVSVSGEPYNVARTALGTGLVAASTGIILPSALRNEPISRREWLGVVPLCVGVPIVGILAGDYVGRKDIIHANPPKNMPKAESPRDQNWQARTAAPAAAESVVTAKGK